MADQLTEMYKAWAADKEPAALTSFEIFQAGLTAGAVSMRERAVALVPNSAQYNELKNKVGSLPDIPETE